MKAVFLEGAKKFSVIDRPEPTRGPDDVLIKITAAGICGSDVHAFEGHSTVVAYPLTPGHEMVGVVEEAPADAHVKPGDRVTVFPTMACGTCKACLDGRDNHCPSYDVKGLTVDGGVFAEKMVMPKHLVLKVPDAISDEVAPVIEPSAVAVHVNKRAGTKPGDAVAVIGSGVIGTVIAMAARAYGAEKIVMIDTLEARRPFLKSVGFDNFVVAGPNTVEEARALVGPVDIVIDTVCFDGTIDNGLDMLAPGGKLVLVASPHGDQKISFSYPKFYKPELSFIGTRNYVQADWHETLQMLAEGRFDPSPLVTGIWPLVDFVTAYGELRAHPEKHLKVLVRP